MFRTLSRIMFTTLGEDRSDVQLVCCCTLHVSFNTILLTRNRALQINIYLLANFLIMTGRSGVTRPMSVKRPVASCIPTPSPRPRPLPSSYLPASTASCVSSALQAYCSNIINSKTNLTKCTVHFRLSLAGVSTKGERRQTDSILRRGREGHR